MTSVRHQTALISEIQYLQQNLIDATLIFLFDSNHIVIVDKIMYASDNVSDIRLLFNLVKEAA